MSVPVLVGFAGVLVAAVATGMLAGRCVRQPEPGFFALAIAALALTVALAAQSLGFDRGFGSATFRAVQLFALLIAPLALVWGLAELTWPSDAARFGARLGAAAVSVVGSVILATDPLVGPPFTKAWPLPGTHDGLVAHYVLDWVQAVMIVIAALCMSLAVRARENRPRGSALLGLAAVGAAVPLSAALCLSLPDRSLYPLLSMVAAALVWLGTTRIPGRSAARAGGGRMDRGRDTGRENGLHGPLEPRDLSTLRNPRDAGDPRDLRAPAPGWYPPEAAVPPLVAPAGLPPTTAAPGQAGYAPHPQQAAAPGRPYGRILIFTLLEDRTADFDRLAGQAAEEVRAGEPGTLVYVIHLVPNAPLQRIFYEIYADRAAFDSHENQPYMQRFASERRACVLATNVIE